MQSMTIEPYLYFNGRCEEALAFYSKAVGAEIQGVMRFSESPEPMPAGMLKPGWENKVMHSSFLLRGAIIMASDGCGSEGGFAGFALSFSVQTEAEADTVFSGLVEGGTVVMPLSRTFWSPRFGMLTDKFGVSWMVMVNPGPGKC